MMVRASERYAEVIDRDRLRAQRVDVARLTYRQLAAAIGSPNSYSYLRRLETPSDQGGRHTCSPERAIAIAVALGIPPHDIQTYFRFHGVNARAA